MILIGFDNQYTIVFSAKPCSHRHAETSWFYSWLLHMKNTCQLPERSRTETRTKPESFCFSMALVVQLVWCLWAGVRAVSQHTQRTCPHLSRKYWLHYNCDTIIHYLQFQNLFLYCNMNTMRTCQFKNAFILREDIHERVHSHNTYKDQDVQSILLAHSFMCAR